MNHEGAPRRNSTIKEAMEQTGPDKVSGQKNITDYKDFVMKKFSHNKPEFQIIDDLISEGFERKEAQEFVRRLSTDKIVKNSKSTNKGAAIGGLVGLISWWLIRGAVASMLDYESGYSGAMMVVAGVWVLICSLVGGGLVWLAKRK